jgi:hypothetical protein
MVALGRFARLDRLDTHGDTNPRYPGVGECELADLDDGSEVAKRDVAQALAPGKAALTEMLDGLREGHAREAAVDEFALSDLP